MEDSQIEMTEQDSADFGELVMKLIDYYIHFVPLGYSEPDFHEKIKNYVKKHIDYVEEMEYFTDFDLDEMVNTYFIYYMNISTHSAVKFYGSHGYRETHFLDALDKEYVDVQLNKLREINTHEQMTTEWYEFRWNHITASSAWKSFGSHCKRNEIIAKKCKPIQDFSNGFVNINSPFHHGHKYEPLSVMLYEKDKKTKIEDFGCLEHENIPYLAASPDGINVDPTSELYGRLLEIKNPVSRKITGIPKKDYWVQMQMQMACTGLHTCDFLETFFVAYENEEEFKADGTFQKTSEGKQKGIIVGFWKGNEPVYEYAPLDISEEDFDKWNEKMFEKHEGLTWIGNTYWYLKTYSCVSVPFCKLWFDNALPYFESIWKDVIHDREHGYEHRLPKKRKPKDKTKSVKKLDASGNEIAEFPNKKTKTNKKAEPCFDLFIDTETLGK